MCDWAFNRMIFHYYPIYVGPSTQEVIITQGLWDFEVSWSPGFVLDPPRWSGLDKKSSRLWNIIHCMPCRTPCRCFMHSNFLGPLRPQAQGQWDSLDFIDHRPLSSSVKWSETVWAFSNQWGIWDFIGHRPSSSSVMQISFPRGYGGTLKVIYVASER
jgi:hypothetical protein